VNHSPLQLCERIRELEARLQESEEIVTALRSGELDAVMVAQGQSDYHLHALVSADEPYRVFIEQVQEGAVTLQQNGTILYGNRRLATMLGLPLEHLAGQALQTFVLAENVAVLSRLFAQAGHGAARGEITLRGERDRQVPVQISLGYLRRDGDQTVLCGMLTDLTEQHEHRREMADNNARLEAEIANRKQVEDVLRHAQKLEAIGALAAGVAHDFNNILQSIVGCLELVQDDFAADAPGRRFVDIALNAAVRGSSLTHHLLSYARQQILQPHTVALAPILAELQEMLTRTLRPNVTVQVHTHQMPAIVVDPGQLQTALLNLAINASHAMPQGGSVSIEAHVESVGGAPWVRIAVTDTGIGMDEATLARATEPFFTTKGVNGCGLGLSMVHGFAAQSGGRFNITSAPGAGTTVELWLPTAAAAEPHSPAAGPAGRHATGRILLVDDNDDVLVTTGAFLKKAGFEVVQAASGEQALALLTAGGRFDALVSDHAMPGMNGAELLAAAHLHQPGLSAVIITGFADASYAASLPAATPVLHKPFQHFDLIAALRLVIEEANNGSASAIR
jgi:PAS domain S-box-containing protein